MHLRRVAAVLPLLTLLPGVTGTITGGWPEGSLITIRTRVTSPPKVVDVFRRTRAAWTVQAGIGHRMKGNVDGWPLEDPDGMGVQVVATRAPEGRSIVFAWPEGTKPPVLSLGGDGKPRVLGFVSDRLLAQLVELPDGAAAALTTEGEIDRWVPGARAPMVTPIPRILALTDPSGSYNPGVAICANFDGVIHVVLDSAASEKAAFLTLGGQAWQVQEIPVRRTGQSGAFCAVGRGGPVWVMLGASGELYRRAGTGAFEHVPYPTMPPLERAVRIEPDPKRPSRLRVVVEEIPPDQRVADAFHGESVFVADDGSVWVTGSRSRDRGIGSTESDVVAALGFRRKIVLRLGPPLPGTPIAWDTLTPGIIEARLSVYEVQGGPSFGRGLWLDPARDCSEAFVRLLDVPQGAPTDVDFPAVRDVVRGRADLAGARMVEARVQGARVLGALVRDLATGKRLLDLVRGRMPLPRARLYCGLPQILRVVPMGIPEEK